MALTILWLQDSCFVFIRSKFKIVIHLLMQIILQRVRVNLTSNSFATFVLLNPGGSENIPELRLQFQKCNKPFPSGYLLKGGRDAFVPTISFKEQILTANLVCVEWESLCERLLVYQDPYCVLRHVTGYVSVSLCSEPLGLSSSNVFDS